MRKSRIVVVGSVNMDLVARMLTLPRPGETILGDDFQTIHGGKGANQAVAAARMGADVVLIGRIGDDSFGKSLRNGLIESGVDTTHLMVTEGCSSGVAMIGVEASGANAITVIAGANGRLTPADIEQRRHVIAESDCLVLQLETPLATIATAIRIAREEGVCTILDPAPAPRTSLGFELMSVDFISPNQTEAEAMTGHAVQDLPSARLAARNLREHGSKQVVLKLGALGALLVDETGAETHVPAQSAKIVDTTAAGDAFTAAFAVSLAEGRNLQDAVSWACAAGTLTCTRFGAQPSLPTRDEIEGFLSGT